MGIGTLARCMGKGKRFAPMEDSGTMENGHTVNPFAGGTRRIISDGSDKNALESSLWI